MNYIVAAHGLFSFFHKDGKLFWCKYNGNSWSDAKILFDDVAENFNICLLGEEISIFTRDNRGSVNRSFFNEKNTVTHTLIRDTSNASSFAATPAEDGINLIYNLPIEGEALHMLMSQNIKSNGAWGPARRIDTITSSQNPFSLIPITDKHFLLFYQTTGGLENRLGYREIYGDELGRYNILHSTMNHFADMSFLATKYAFHGVCAIKGIFGTRLVYRNKGEDGFSRGIALTEGQNVGNIVIYMMDDKLHLMFELDGILYNGLPAEQANKWNFSAAQVQDISPRRLTKAAYISSHKKGFLSSQLLVDALRPWEIYMLSSHILAPYTSHNHNIFPVLGDRILTAAETETDYNNFFDNMEDELWDIKNGHI